MVSGRLGSDFVYSLLPGIRISLHLGGCSWNEFSMLYYFAGFNGYLLLGHYLRNHDWSLGKIVGIGIPMFVVAMPLLSSVSAIRPLCLLTRRNS